MEQIIRSRKKRRRQLATPSAEGLQSLDAAQLALTVESQASVIADLRNQIRDLSTAKNYYKTRSETLQERVEAVEDERNALVARVNFRVRPGHRFVSDLAGYTMAIAKAQTTSSSKDTVMLMAGDEARGALKDKSIPMRYQTMACVAQRILSKRKHAGITDIIRSSTGNHLSPDRSFKYILYKADTPKQEALQKSKVHVATCAASWYLESMVSDSSNFAEDLSASTCSTKSFCDLQESFQGNGAEMCELVRRELSSVGCEALESIAKTANVNNMVCVLPCLDQGPDNVGWVSRMMSLFEHVIGVTFWCPFCSDHKTHFSAKDVLAVLECWEWEADCEIPVQGYGSTMLVVQRPV